MVEIVQNFRKYHETSRKKLKNRISRAEYAAKFDRSDGRRGRLLQGNSYSTQLEEVNY